MNKIFCVACGHKNIYEIQKPKFCAGCGSGVSGDISVSSKTEKSKERMDVDLGDASSDSTSFDLNKLKGQIVAESSSKKITLGDIMGSSSGGGSDEFSREASNLPDGQDLLNMSKDDCGSSRSTDIDG